MTHFWPGTTASQVRTFALFIITLAAAGAATAELPEPYQKDGRIGYRVDAQGIGRSMKQRQSRTAVPSGLE